MNIENNTINSNNINSNTINSSSNNSTYCYKQKIKNKTMK